MAITVDACKVSPTGKSVGESSLRRKAYPLWGNAADSTLPRKTSKENKREPYLKPTQVDEENIQRRSRERLLRNSAN